MRPCLVIRNNNDDERGEGVWFGEARSVVALTRAIAFTLKANRRNRKSVDHSRMVVAAQRPIATPLVKKYVNIMKTLLQTAM